MFKVHGVALSPFVRKVLLALEYKGIPYESVPVMPGADDAGFRAISPLGKIPVLEHDGFFIPDTSVICRYIDRVFPDKPLYPADPKEEAKATWLEEFGDSKLIEACAGLFQQRFLYPKMFGQDTDEAVVANILDNLMPPLLAYLESQTPAEGALLDHGPSIADIGIVTCFMQAEYGSFTPDAGKYPKLAAYLGRVYESDVIKARKASETEVVKALAG